jgi:hypothetical protein
MIPSNRTLPLVMTIGPAITGCGLESASHSVGARVRKVIASTGRVVTRSLPPGIVRRYSEANCVTRRLLSRSLMRPLVNNGSVSK